MRQQSYPGWLLAQFNVVYFKYDFDHLALASFIEQVGRINQSAEDSPGFVWRYTGSANPTVSIDVLPDGSVLGALSLWETQYHLREFVYRSAHRAVMRRRHEWMFESDRVSAVCWWQPDHQPPTIASAWDNLVLLRERGPSPNAFGIAHLFPPPSQT
jgi:hypothetical protein